MTDSISKAIPQTRMTPGAMLLTVVAILAAAVFLETLAPVSLASAQRQNPNTFLVYGSVHDTDGRPMAEVEVVVSSGNGTLRQTGVGKTMLDGTFAVNFSPGMPVFSTPSETAKNGLLAGGGGGQAAIVRAQKKGYYEVTLCRQGSLRMADFFQEGDGDSISTVENTVLPDQPFHVSFVMAPAATISGRLVNVEGKPLVGKKVTLNGDTLPPAQNVLDSTKTDEDGQFSFTEVPLRPYWFEINEVKSEPVVFNLPDEYQVALISREGDSPTLEFAGKLGATPRSSDGLPMVRQKADP